MGDEYSIAFLNADTALAGLKYPKFFSVGGNTGKVNTFTGVAPEDITGGVFNGATLGEGNNAFCFATQFMTQAAPDSIKCSGVLNSITTAMKPITSALSAFNCPQLKSIDETQFDKFPVSILMAEESTKYPWIANVL